MRGFVVSIFELQALCLVNKVELINANSLHDDGVTFRGSRGNYFEHHHTTDGA